MLELAFLSPQSGDKNLATGWLVVTGRIDDHWSFDFEMALVALVTDLDYHLWQLYLRFNLLPSLSLSSCDSWAAGWRPVKNVRWQASQWSRWLGTFWAGRRQMYINICLIRISHIFTKQIYVVVTYTRIVKHCTTEHKFMVILWELKRGVQVSSGMGVPNAYAPWNVFQSHKDSPHPFLPPSLYLCLHKKPVLEISRQADTNVLNQ